MIIRCFILRNILQVLARHRMEFRDNIELLQKVQTVLEYLVGQGSRIAFFVREEI